MSLDPLSPDTRDASLPQALVQRLRDLDEELPEALRAQCLAAGASIVPDLIVLLEDEVLADEESEYGWAPLNAAELLGTLGDVRAIPVLLRCDMGSCSILTARRSSRHQSFVAEPSSTISTGWSAKPRPRYAPNSPRCGSASTVRRPNSAWMRRCLSRS